MVFKGVKKKVDMFLKDSKESSRQRSAANRAIKKKAQAEFFRAKEKEELKLARERARLQAQQKLSSMKKRVNPPKKGKKMGLGLTLPGLQPMGKNTGFDEVGKSFGGFFDVDPFTRNPKPRRKSSTTRKRRKRRKRKRR